MRVPGIEPTWRRLSLVDDFYSTVQYSTYVMSSRFGLEAEFTRWNLPQYTQHYTVEAHDPTYRSTKAIAVAAVGMSMGLR